MGTRSGPNVTTIIAREWGGGKGRGRKGEGKERERKGEGRGGEGREMGGRERGEGKGMMHVSSGVHGTGHHLVTTCG